MKTLKKWQTESERQTERNQWKDLNKKHDVSSFDLIVYTQEEAEGNSDIIFPYPDLFRLCMRSVVGIERKKAGKAKVKGKISCLPYKYFLSDYLW